MNLSLSFTEYVQRLSQILLSTSVRQSDVEMDIEAGFAEYIGHLVEATGRGNRVFSSATVVPQGSVHTLPTITPRTVGYGLCRCTMAQC